jgi:hypothetical protein
MMALKGFIPVTDDITAVEFKDNSPVILPGIPHLKLWQDAILKMNLKTQGLKKVRDELEKYYYPVKGSIKITNIPLRRIYVMSTNYLEGISIKPVTGIEKFTVLKNHTYRYNYLKNMGLEIKHFDLATSLGSKVEVCRLFRSKKGFDAEELAEAVIKDLKKK